MTPSTLRKEDTSGRSFSKIRGQPDTVGIASLEVCLQRKENVFKLIEPLLTFCPSSLPRFHILKIFQIKFSISMATIKIHL